MKRKLLIPALGFLISTALHAAVISTEGFDFNGPDLAGNGSGSGWSGVWSETAGDWQVGAGSLSYGILSTSGNRIVSQTNGTNIGARSMSTAAPSSGEFWASIVVNSNSLGGGLSFDKAGSTANLHLLSTLWGDRARFGFGINGANYVYTLDGRTTSPVIGSVGGATGAATLLIAKFDVTAGTFSMWANPDITGANPSGGTLVADNVSFTRTGATFAGDVQTLGAYANWAGVGLDEIRLGTSFADVAPVSGSAPVAPLGVVVAIAGANVELTFDTVDGQSYQVLVSTDEMANFAPVGEPGSSGTGDGSPLTLSDPGGTPAPGEKVFYKVEAN